MLNPLRRDQQISRSDRFSKCPQRQKMKDANASRFIFFITPNMCGTSSPWKRTSKDIGVKPTPRDLIAEVRLIKLGKRLAVGDVQIYCDGEDEMVAHATSTYSIPPPEQRKV